MLNNWRAASSILPSFVAIVTGYVQEPLSYQSYDNQLFSPLEDLSLLSASEFTTLGHPLFPDYHVRIKKSDFCDGTVRYRFLLNASNARSCANGKLIEDVKGVHWVH